MSLLGLSFTLIIFMWVPLPISEVKDLVYKHRHRIYLKKPFLFSFLKGTFFNTYSSLLDSIMLLIEAKVSVSKLPLRCGYGVSTLRLHRFYYRASALRLQSFYATPTELLCYAYGVFRLHLRRYDATLTESLRPFWDTCFKKTFLFFFLNLWKVYNKDIFLNTGTVSHVFSIFFVRSIGIWNARY